MNKQQLLYIAKHLAYEQNDSESEVERKTELELVEYIQEKTGDIGIFLVAETDTHIVWLSVDSNIHVLNVTDKYTPCNSWGAETDEVFSETFIKTANL